METAPVNDLRVTERSRTFKLANHQTQTPFTRGLAFELKKLVSYTGQELTQLETRIEWVPVPCLVETRVIYFALQLEPLSQYV